MTVADFIIATLKASGVRRIFGIPRVPSTDSPMHCVATVRSPGDEVLEVAKTNLRQLARE